jgi:Secretion system C-terminal sorting domain
MKKITIILAVFLFNALNLKCQSIDSVGVNYSLDTLDIGYKLIFYGGSDKQSRTSFKYNIASDTLNVFSYIKFSTSGSTNVKGFYSSLNIPVSNFQKLCYLNFYTVTDTNSIYNPWDTFYAFYPLDTMSYDFHHCWPLAIYNNIKNDIAIYPNPCSTVLNIEESPNVFYNISAINLQGQTLPINSYKTANNIIANTSTLLPGFYFLKLESTNGVVYQKFRKE